MTDDGEFGRRDHQGRDPSDRARATFHGDTIVRGRYDGDYEKTSLPDELILTSYLTVRDGKIVTLIIIRNTPASY
jgi:hypothetical protein